MSPARPRCRPMVDQITQKFEVSFRSNLRAKLRQFWRRGVWGYVVAGGLLGVAEPGLLGSFGLTVLGVFLGCCTLSGLVIAGSSYMQRRQTGFRGEITFRATGLLLRSADLRRSAEGKDWSWVVRWNESASYFYLLVPLPPRFRRLYLLLPKHRLRAEEVTTLRQWLAQRPH